MALTCCVTRLDWFLQEKKVSVAVADRENATLHSAEKKVPAAVTEKQQAILHSSEKKVPAGADNKKTKLNSPATRATKSSRIEKEKKKQRVLPSTTAVNDVVVPGTQAGNCSVDHSQTQETSGRLEGVNSNTQLEILTMKQDVERRQSTLMGQIEEMKSNPLEATKSLNNSRVASLHSEGRELRRDIRRIERGISHRDGRLSLESQSINEQSQAVLADIARMERENARHVTELERLRTQHDKLLSSSSFHNVIGVDVDNSSSSSGPDDRIHEDQDHFHADVIASIQDKSHDVEEELGKQQRPAQINKHDKKKF